MCVHISQYTYTHTQPYKMQIYTMHVITAETREHFACTSPTDWAKLLQTAPQRCLQSMGSPACTKLYPLYSATCWITRICSAVTHRSQSHNLPPPPPHTPPAAVQCVLGYLQQALWVKQWTLPNSGLGEAEHSPCTPLQHQHTLQTATQLHPGLMEISSVSSVALKSCWHPAHQAAETAIQCLKGD